METTQVKPAPPEQNEPIILFEQAKEYVGASQVSPFIPGPRGLPQAIDDAERDFGLSIYDKMRTEVILAAALNAVKLMVFENGATITPAVGEPAPEVATPEELAEAERAKEVADFVRRCLSSMERRRRRPFLEIAREMLDAMVYGHKIAEIVTEYCEDGQDKGKTVLKALKTKDKKFYAFVTDHANNLLGVMAVVPGRSLVIRSGLGINLNQENILPPEKFWMLSFGGQEGDPRGTSFFRAAYDPWWRKQHGKIEETKSLAQFGGGMLIATVGPNVSAQEVENDDGTTEIAHRTTAVMKQLEQLASGGVGAFEDGTVVDRFSPSHNGEAFDSHQGRCDREMVMALLVTARTLLESNRNSKADAGQAQDMGDAVKFYLREAFAASFNQQVIYPLVQMNFGDEVAETLLPQLTMVKVSKPDFAANASALAQIGFALEESQFASIDREYGFTPRTGKTDAEKGEPKDEAE